MKAKLLRVALVVGTMSLGACQNSSLPFVDSHLSRDEAAKKLTDSLPRFLSCNIMAEVPYAMPHSDPVHDALVQGGYMTTLTFQQQTGLSLGGDPQYTTFVGYRVNEKTKRLARPGVQGVYLPLNRTVSVTGISKESDSTALVTYQWSLRGEPLDGDPELTRILLNGGACGFEWNWNGTTSSGDKTVMFRKFDDGWRLER